METNRKVRSRNGNLLKALAVEKDRQRRPGTPMRNQRPVNFIRGTESAVPVQLNYSDFSGDEEKVSDRKEIDLSKAERASAPLQGFATGNDRADARQEIRTPPALDDTRDEKPARNSLAPQPEILFRRPSEQKRPPSVESSGSIRLDCDDAQVKVSQISVNKEQQKGQKTQATSTNTITTEPGLSLLEGIHAGVGFGLDAIKQVEESFLSRRSSSVEEMYDSLAAQEQSKGRVERLRVPPYIFFDRCSGKRRTFVGTLKIRNVSAYFVSFCVKTSDPELFDISPAVGMLLPFDSQKVFIRTNPKYDFIFKDIAGEVFKVFATPVYTRCQMKTEKLEVLWRAFGTPMFPRIAAEEHTINYIYQKTCRKDSILASISRNHRWLSSFWGNAKPVPINEHPISEEEFYQVWPLEDDHYNFMNCRNQLDGWFWHLKKAREETRQMRYEMRQCLAILLIALFVGIVFWTQLYPIPRNFRMNHDFVHAATDWMKVGLEQTEERRHRTHWDRLMYNLIHWPVLRQWRAQGN